MDANNAQTASPVTARMYAGEQDLEQMQVMLMQARAQTDDWRYAHVGDLLFNFFMVACHLDPKTFIRLWHAGERLVGYAILSEDPLIDWQVLPDYEWRGIESVYTALDQQGHSLLRSLDMIHCLISIF